MDIDEIKEWLRIHGDGAIFEQYNPANLEYMVRWYSRNGMKFIGFGDTSDQATERVFMDIVETLYHNSK